MCATLMCFRIYFLVSIKFIIVIQHIVHLETQAYHAVNFIMQYFPVSFKEHSFSQQMNMHLYTKIINQGYFGWRPP